MLEQTGLPLIDKNNSPVFYIGTGMPISGYNFVQRLLKEGFYVNLGIYPAVPVKNTGVRITISRHNKANDIKGLVEAMVHHYEAALEETGASLLKVRKAFKIPTKEVEDKMTINHDFNIVMADSIQKVEREKWNKMYGGKGVLDWDGQYFLENVFKNNKKEEHNWIFSYLIIYDKNEEPILATSLSYSLWKDDLLAPASTSLKVEEQRKSMGPYYLTSPVLSTGSIFTEGDHIYINKSHPQLTGAWKIFLGTLEAIDHEKYNSSMIVLRDFFADNPYNSIFHDRGFVKVNMPESCSFSDFNWETTEEYVAGLSRRSRRHFAKDIAPFQDSFSLEVRQNVQDEELQIFQVLYENVRQNNPGLNTFPFPEKVFHQMNENSNWEFLLLSLKIRNLQ